MSLDPKDWSLLRRQGHEMLDHMLDHLEGIRESAVWRKPRDEPFYGDLSPAEPTDLQEVHQSFLTDIQPYGSGNLHPGFMGWAQGAGTPVGALAEMLAAGLNANVGGRHHAAVLVERQIATWMRTLFAFPETSEGLFTTGTSQANFIAVLVARNRVLGERARTAGVAASPTLVAYASSQVHGCLARAMDMAGLGADQLRVIDVDDDFRMKTKCLEAKIEEDRSAGYLPFLIVGTAGTVNTGAIDDLDALSDIARRQNVSFHVDGAIGALLAMSDRLKPRLKGLAKCDSLAFDFHKWAHVPYDAGFLLVRDGSDLKRSFSSENAYLARSDAGLAGGDWWPCDYGPDLSRGFRALKTWYTLKTYGTTAIGAEIERNVDLAQELGRRIDAHPDLERMAPVSLNIVCYRHRGSDQLNRRLVDMIHEDGRVAPSLTTLNGRVAIRAAIFNHRTTIEDIESLVAISASLGAKLMCEQGRADPLPQLQFH